MEIAGTMPDATLDSAVASIMKKISDDDGARVDVNGNDREDLDARDNREGRDVTEREGTGDLEAAEREDRAAKAGENEDGEAGGDDAGADEQFIELPPETDGGEPTRIPAKEAADAWQKLRQMDGDIASAVIKAEEEAFTKHDQTTQALNRAFETVRDQARVALQMMQQYLPQAPDPILLDENSGYYDPAGYHRAKLYYDGYVAHYNKVQATLKQSEDGLKAVGGQQDTELTRRENDRASRYIPEWKDEKTRAAKQQEYADILGPKFGLTLADVREIGDHRAVRILDALVNSMKQAKAAPEVKKHLQETKPKITKGRANPNRDNGTGRFVSDARKQLKESGSEAAFASWALRSGLVE